ncbi:MAG: prolyl oligopeptidase family serine peptidase [Prevotellaceae bacterium]|nr:prolyl oligopeptidase family serine peptidase [Candidatus Minthosoma caballi]
MKKLLSLTFLAAATLTVSAQGTVQDYKNAFAIRGKYSNKMTNGNVSAHRRGESNFWYSVFNGDETLYYEVNAKTGEKTIIEDPTPRRRPERIDGTQHHWMEVLDEKDGRAENPANGRQRIIHKNNNLYLMEEGTSETSTQITTDGVDTCYYSSWGRWSKDGKYYATVKIKPAPKHYVTYTLSSPTSQVQPIYSNQEYAKPGDSLNYRIPVIVDVENCKVIEPKSTALFASQYDVSAPVWDEDFKSVTFEFNERGHKTFRVLEMNLMGDVKTIIEEKNDKYVAYSRNLRRNLGNGKILWKSDRDGHAHLYLYDRKTGKHTQITKGDFWVRDVQHYSIDEKGKGYIIFSANGMNCKNMGIVTSSFDGEIKEEDPYNVHYYRIDINGKNLVFLTPERGNHSATLNGDQTALIDTYSSIDKAPITVLRSATDGKIITTLETADIAKLESNGWKAPEVFVAPGRDGKTDMWGIIQRPTNFDPNKKYPVIEYIYSGPGDQYVPKSFTPWLWNLADLAELGFIVVQLDAMTTSFRSLDFEQVCYKNLKDSGFPDRIEWIKAAAKKYPYMDIENMGIYGCSAGGQEALGALLFHPEFYKVGYAACGCHDNRMDKIWWNEQWMGYPVDSSYIECSNVENAKNLQGKLMLLVGEMDDNVDPSSTYQVVNALQKANKDFEFVLIPGAHHTMGETFGEHKRYDFFVKNLLGVDPPSWSSLK